MKKDSRLYIRLQETTKVKGMAYAKKKKTTISKLVEDFIKGLK